MIYGATFADHRMQMSAKLARASMLANGVDHVKTLHSVHVTGERGAGYWRWMPDIVIQGIKSAIDDGADFFVYTDAGVEFVRSIRHITDRMNPDDHVWLFGNEHSHEDWCKADVLRALDWRGTAMDRQVQASVHVWRASWQAYDIASQWDRACSPKWMIDDSPSSLPNVATFKEHRHPQATLTCVAHTNAIPLHWWPTQYGHFIKHRYRGDTYPQLFAHHGRRDPHAGDGRETWSVNEYNTHMAKYV
jgi:hypothetical protein